MIDFFISLAYYNSNRTPRTSHESDVTHGETFFIRKRGNIVHLKEPTTFEEQLELIKDKGFFISEYKKQECDDPAVPDQRLFPVAGNDQSFSDYQHIFFHFVRKTVNFSRMLHFRESRKFMNLIVF